MPEATLSSQAPSSLEERSQAPPRAPFARRLTVFAVAAAIPAVLALNGGGYDIVDRQKLGIVIWAVIALGFAFGVLPRAGLGRGAFFALGSIGVLAALTAIALTWTKSSEYTFAELARVLQYAGLLTLAFTALNRATWRTAAGGLAAAVLFIPLLSLVSRLAPDLIADHTAHSLHSDRLSHPFGYWNAVACWGGMAVAVGLAWSAHGRTIVTRCLALALVPSAALTVYLTYSRGGVIAVIVAVIAAVAFARNRWTTAAHALVAAAATGFAILSVRAHHAIADATGGTGARSVLLVLLVGGVACAATAALTRIGGGDRIRLGRQASRVAVAVSVVVLAGAAAAAHHPLSRAWDQFRNERTVSTGPAPTARLSTFGGTRYDVWSSAVEAFDSEPLHGIGPGTFEFYWAQHGTNPEFLRDAHSIYLENLAELGVPGLVVILAMLGGLLATAIVVRARLRRSSEIGANAALVAAFVVFLFYAGVDWIWEMPAIGALALGGIAVAGAAASPRWGRPLPLAPRLALIGVALIAVAIQVPGLVSTQRERASADALAAGDPIRAARLANDAIDAEPWAASPYVSRALVEERQRHLAAARDDLTKALDRDPNNWRHHVLLARIYADAGNRAAVIRELAQVRRLAPHSVYLTPGWPGRGRIDAVLGRP